MRIIILFLIIIISTTMVAAAITINCDEDLEVKINSTKTTSIAYATCSEGYLIIKAVVHNQSSCVKTAVINISNTIIRIPVQAEPSTGACTYIIDTRAISPTRLNPGQEYTISLGVGAEILVKAYQATEAPVTTSKPQTGNNTTLEHSLLPYTGSKSEARTYTPGKTGEHKILKALLIISLLTSTALAAVKEYG